MKRVEELRDVQLALPPIIMQLRAGIGELRGVVGVGVGFKTRGGIITDEIAWTVNVVKKFPMERLVPAQRIPARIDGIATDVREVRAWRSLADEEEDQGNDETYSTLEDGISISTDSYRDVRGTLGCFARLRSDPTKIVLLTNHHVLYDHPTKKGPGDLVGQPRISSTRCCRTGVVAETLDGVRGPLVDAAIAKLNGKRPWIQKLTGIGPDADGKNEDLIVATAPAVSVGGIMTTVICGETVRKLGRATGVTSGTIVALDAPMENPDHYHPEIKVKYEHQVLILPTGAPDALHRLDFAREGDSGSVVINARNQVVGLLHTAGPMNNSDLANVGPCAGATIPHGTGNLGGMSQIHDVLDALKIDIIPSVVPKTAPTGALLPGGMVVRRPMNVAELVRADVLDDLIARLDASVLGKRLLALYEQHGPEIRELLEHDRRAKVAWHRNHGPSFVAKLISGMTSLEQPIPTLHEGIALVDGMQRVAAAFVERASPELAAAAERYLPLLLELLDGAARIRDLLDRISREPDPA
jgi:hypothetical protein